MDILHGTNCIPETGGTWDGDVAMLGDNNGLLLNHLGQASAVKAWKDRWAGTSLTPQGLIDFFGGLSQDPLLDEETRTGLVMMITASVTTNILMLTQHMAGQMAGGEDSVVALRKLDEAIDYAVKGTWADAEHPEGGGRLSGNYDETARCLLVGMARSIASIVSSDRAKLPRIRNMLAKRYDNCDLPLNSEQQALMFALTLSALPLLNDNTYQATRALNQEWLVQTGARKQCLSTTAREWLGMWGVSDATQNIIDALVRCDVQWWRSDIWGRPELSRLAERIFPSASTAQEPCNPTLRDALGDKGRVGDEYAARSPYDWPPLMRLLWVHLRKTPLSKLDEQCLGWFNGAVRPRVLGYFASQLAETAATSPHGMAAKIWRRAAQRLGTVVMDNARLLAKEATIGTEPHVPPHIVADWSRVMFGAAYTAGSVSTWRKAIDALFSDANDEDTRALAFLMRCYYSGALADALDFQTPSDDLLFIHWNPPNGRSLYKSDLLYLKEQYQAHCTGAERNVESLPCQLAAHILTVRAQEITEVEAKRRRHKAKKQPARAVPVPPTLTDFDKEIQAFFDKKPWPPKGGKNTASPLHVFARSLLARRDGAAAGARAADAMLLLPKQATKKTLPQRRWERVKSEFVAAVSAATFAHSDTWQWQPADMVARLRAFWEGYVERIAELGEHDAALIEEIDLAALTKHAVSELAMQEPNMTQWLFGIGEANKSTPEMVSFWKGAVLSVLSFDTLAEAQLPLAKLYYNAAVAYGVAVKQRPYHTLPDTEVNNFVRQTRAVRDALFREGALHGQRELWVKIGVSALWFEINSSGRREIPTALRGLLEFLWGRDLSISNGALVVGFSYKSPFCQEVAHHTMMKNLPL